MRTNQLKDKYKRHIIKLGNSKAITFPQEWTNLAGLQEKSIVSLYPIDEKTLLIRVTEKDKKKVVFNLDTNEWPLELIRQAIISAFKLNIDEINLKYTEKNYEQVYSLLIELRKEVIGMDFKILSDLNTFNISFLVDISKTLFQDVLMDLAEIFRQIIINIVENRINKNNELLLAELDRKYSLGIRILITGLTDYPIAKVYKEFPIIRFLGDRVLLLYIRDFINEALTIQHLPEKFIQKYKEILEKIPSLLIDIITNYRDIKINDLQEFQKYLLNLNNILENIDFIDKSEEEHQIRNCIKYYLRSFQDFYDIGITRIIESEIGMT
ncbi:MAG: hypothetical protein ACP6IY_01605 [Promethearchaeia archaeon]